jgi:glycosyltransferase involved in cell wall biosynthesis
MRIRRQPIDIVHVHSSIAAVLARSFLPADAALVYSPHALAVAHERAWVRAGATLVERGLVGRTHAFAAVSEPEREQLIDMTRSRRPVVMVPHSLETSATPLPYGQREAQVVAVGRLSYQKNPESVLDVPAHLGNLLDRPMRFLWVGDGDAERRAELLAHGWEVAGWLPRSEVNVLVSRARALLHPARYEGMPFAVAEALAVGTPVVAADIPALRTFPSVMLYRSPDELVVKLAAVANDRQLWAMRSAESQRQIEDAFNESTQALALGELYDAALDRTAARA